jgi:3-dehydro-L-gulonate 2-dehydrogenase
LLYGFCRFFLEEIIITMENYINIPASEMHSEFKRILKKTGFTDVKAEKCAGIFTSNSIDGIYTHGVNRFPRFISNVKDGFVKPDAEPSLAHSAGSLEQWNGNFGPGPLNAVFATDRAEEIADKNGIGLVAMGFTNHWMRAGYYGWNAAKKGYVFIAWTNAEANMSAWGATDPRIGNNPLVLAVPFRDEAIVIDFAMTQFSYGKMELYMSEEKQLPFPGGFDSKGNLTTDPGKILQTWRALPIGYWKGSGFALLLDILAAILSGGRSTAEITRDKKEKGAEFGVSQVFIAINPGRLKNYPSIEDTIQQVIDFVHASVPENDKSVIRYPGENVLKVRKKNQEAGIPVNRKVWTEIQSL